MNNADGDVVHGYFLDESTMTSQIQIIARHHQGRVPRPQLTVLPTQLAGNALISVFSDDAVEV